MRLLITFLLALAYVLVPAKQLHAQLSTFGKSNSTQEQAPSNTTLPAGSYVPNQLIIHFPQPEIPGILKSEFASYHGVNVEVFPIDTKGHYFLINVASGIDDNKCDRIDRVDYPLECTMCEIMGNPGGGGPMDRRDGLWPNYLGNPESINDDTGFNGYPEDIIFPQGIYNPLVGEPEPPVEDGTEPVESDCYEGYSIPNAGGLENGQRAVKVAVLDSGIEVEEFHEFYRYQSEGQSFSIVQWAPTLPVDPNTVIGPSNEDPNGHGTAVAFLIAHDFVNRGAEVDIELHSYRILNEMATGTLADALRSVDRAIDDGMDIINLSFGFTELQCNNTSVTSAKTVFDDLFLRAKQQEVVIFVSAGNDDNNLDTSPQFPAVHGSGANIITVGADGCTPGVKWAGSNYNSDFVDVMAPGYKIAVPYAGSFTSINGLYIFVSGTSFATPIAVSSAAAYHSAGGYGAVMCAFGDEAGGDADVSDQDSRLGSLLDFDYSDCDDVSIISEEEPNDCTFCDQQNRGATTSRYAYPNPFEDQIIIPNNLDDTESQSIRILDSSGRIWFEGSTTDNSTPINTSSLSPGVYFLQIVDSSGSRVQRIIKK